MTDDIVERLRRDLASGLSASIGDTEEAAAEIERLRAALRDIAEAAGDPSAYMIARDALSQATNKT